MNWKKFDNHGEPDYHAFEVMCNILFKYWCKKEYKDKLVYFSFVNGSGGDGGVEAYGILDSGDVIAVQSKWFPDKFEDAQIKQIEKSFYTALSLRPNITKYIVCIPKDLSSIRNVKGNKSSTKSEESRWQNLKKKIKESNPSVYVELWTGTIIQEKLNLPESSGIYNYWFNKPSIYDEEIINAFERATSSWAKENYIPNLYSVGYIQDNLDEFTKNYSFVKSRYDYVEHTIVQLDKLKKSYTDLIKIDCLQNDCDLKKRFCADISTIENWLDRLRCIEPLLIEGSDIKEQFDYRCFKLEFTETYLLNHNLYHDYYAHFSSIIKILKKIHNDVFECCDQLFSFEDNRLIFLGKQGAGKTSGIVSSADLFLKEKSHLPILIRARDYDRGDTWLSILKHSLLLSDDWDLFHLFKALETTAFLRNKSRNVDSKYKIQPKCIICVDGIDESPSWDFWKERIEEAKTFEDRFDGIKFIFLSRPYVFSDNHKTKYSKCINRIPYFGDVPVSEIFDRYIDFYNISLGDNHWVKKFLRTPFALKLFCEVFQGRTLELLPANTTVLTKLYEKKIYSIENKFRRMGKENSNQRLIHNFLVIFSSLIVNYRTISYEDIYNSVDDSIKNNLEDILIFVEKEGFIEFRESKKDPFTRVERFYTWGKQLSFEYLIAVKQLDNIKKGLHIDIKRVDGISQMLSLLAIEEDNKLLNEYQNINISEDISYELLCFALSNSSIESVSNKKFYLNEMMNNSVQKFRDIFDRIILPVSCVSNHPLGARFLDNFLRKFNKPAERDVWWAIPSNLNCCYGAEWYSNAEINTSSIDIPSDEDYFGLPLIFVWRLSSVDNRVRYESRLKLISWGINNQEKYFLLFVIV